MGIVYQSTLKGALVIQNDCLIVFQKKESFKCVVVDVLLLLRKIVMTEE
jgi:hypothetical protein